MKKTLTFISKVIKMILAIAIIFLLIGCVILGIVLTPIHISWELAEKNSGDVHDFVDKLTGEKSKTPGPGGEEAK